MCICFVCWTCVFCLVFVGQVGNLVLSQLKSIVHDESHYRDLVGRSIEEDIQTQDLPKEWSCNVIEGKRRRRQILLRSSIK
jgi:hypothetical protein